MQYITSSSYNDINITNILDGNNSLTSKLKINQFNEIATINDSTFRYRFENTDVDNIQALIWVYNITITKPDITSITYYEFVDAMPKEDRHCYFESNAFSNTDNITIVMMGYKYNRTYSNVGKVIIRPYSDNKEFKFPIIANVKLTVFYI